MLAAYGFDDRVNRWLSESVPEDADGVEGDHGDGDAVVAEGDGAGVDGIVNAFGGAVVSESSHPYGVEFAVMVSIIEGIGAMGLLEMA